MYVLFPTKTVSYYSIIERPSYAFCFYYRIIDSFVLAVLIISRFALKILNFSVLSYITWSIVHCIHASN